MSPTVKPLAGSLQKHCLNLPPQTCLSDCHVTRRARHWPSGFTTKLSHRGSLAPTTKKTLHQGSLAPCKTMLQHDHICRCENAGSPEPDVDLAAHRTALLRRFYPIFTPFLPPYYPNGAVFTPFLPPFLPRRLPRFYPVFTLFRRVKSRVYPKFTPVPRFLPQQAFYPNFSTYAPFLPQFYPRGKTGLFLLVYAHTTP